MASQYGVLSTGTVLNMRYWIMEKERFYRCFFYTQYVAFDAVSQKKVHIAEFFSHEYAVRNPDDSIAVQNYTCFQQGLNWFRKHIYYADSMPDGMPKLLDRFQQNGTEYAVLEWRDSEWPLIEWITENPFALPMSMDAAVNLLSGAMEELSRLHNSGFVFRWLTDDTIHVDLQTGKTHLFCFGNIGLYPDTNEDPIDDFYSEPRRGMFSHTEPLECCMRKKDLGPHSAVYSLCAMLYFLTTKQTVPCAPERMMEPWCIPWGLFAPPVHAVMEKGLAVRSHDRYQSVEAFCWALRCALRDCENQRTMYTMPATGC